MRVEGDHVFQASREDVWQGILDPHVLSKCLPGFETLEQVSEGEYEGAMNLRVGPVQGKFQGRLTLSDLRPPEGYVLELNGRGAAGFMEGQGSVSLDEKGEGTKLTYDIDIQVGGRIAGVGQRLLDSTSRVLTEEALQGLDRHFASLAAPGDDEGAAQAAEAPTQAQVAGRVAKGVVADLIPAERRPMVAVVASVMLAGLGFLLLRACGG